MKVSADLLIELSEALHRDRHRVQADKMVVYAAVKDCLADFDDDAHQLRIAPEMILATHAAKHWRAIMAYCRDTGVPDPEAIKGRIMDLMNYLDMLHAMCERRKTTI